MRRQRFFFLQIVCVLLALKAAAQEKASLNSVTRKQIIDSTCNVMLRNYVYPEMASKMCDYLRQKQKKGEYDTVADRRQFASSLTKDLRKVYADNHLSIRYDPDLESRVRAFVATAKKDSAELRAEKKQNFFFRKVELLKGNIGYIVFTNFADTSEGARKTVRAAMQFVANADAVIFDLRNNFGGRSEMANEIASYFFNKPQLIGRVFNRITNGWREEWISNRPAITGGLRLTMPVYILTSERTFSAAEGLAYNLQHLTNAVVVGDTTRGGAHATRSFALGNGFVGFIPFTRIEHAATKTDWEGVGVVPTIAIKEEQSLPKAQEAILIQRLPAVTDSVEGRKLQWLLNDLRAGSASLVVPEETLKQYTGSFEEFVFTLEDGSLFCTNTHQRDKKDRLVAITDYLFKIDNESQVEFIRDKNGTVSDLRLLWNDGWTDVIKKNK